MLLAPAAVIVEQRAVSTVTAGTATICAVLVVAAMLGPWGAPSRPADRLLHP